MRATSGLNRASVITSGGGGSGGGRARITCGGWSGRLSHKVDAVTSDVVCCISFPQQCSTDLLPF